MGANLGYEGDIYYKVGGIGGAGSWVRLGNCQDETVTNTRARANATTRANNGYVAEKGGLKTLGLSWSMVYDPADADFQAFRDAYNAGDAIGIATTQGGDPSAGSGQVFDAEVFTFDFQRNLSDTQTISVEVAPSYSAANPPAFISGGATI